MSLWHDAAFFVAGIASVFVLVLTVIASYIVRRAFRELRRMREDSARAVRLFEENRKRGA